MEILEVVRYHISVATVLVAEARGPGFDCPATQIFSHYFGFYLDPFN